MMRLALILRRSLAVRNQSSFKYGDSVRENRTITTTELDVFSSLTGDHNPIHKHPNAIVHGAFLNSIVAGIIGTKLPGAGSIVVSQSFNFPAKCYVNIPIEIFVELSDKRKLTVVNYKCTQNDQVVFQGEAKIKVTQ